MPRILVTGRRKEKKVRPMPTENEGKRGFTFIEVMAALLLLTVIASLVMPEIFRNTRNMEAKVALRQIERDLAQLYRESKGTGLTMEAIFQPGSDEYQVVIGSQQLTRPLYGVKYVADTEARLVFKPDGSIEGADEIEFRDDLGREFLWKAEPLRGD